jgi:uncharacterized protein (DUF1800 family)
MGRYLDMVNNDKPDAVANTHANENYARELMQIFTLGTYLLNQDGTLKLDGSGNPQPTYAQADIQSFARAYTGWTYPTQPGSTLQKHNPVNWLGPMEAFDSNHDVAAKTLLRGTVLPAGQTSLQDLNGALDNIFNHPNLPPFVAKQLIQHLVTSNPSGAYVRRVADVFASGTYNGFGNGQRGDLQAVIAAILLDPEARRSDSPSTANAADGHLMEPIPISPQSSGPSTPPAMASSPSISPPTSASRPCARRAFSTSSRRASKSQARHCSAPSLICRPPRPHSSKSIS